jgi:uncharacterized repeat protein (TIGR01451 family)
MTTTPTLVLPKIELTKSAAPNPAKPGDTVAYTISYRNTGLAPATDFTITDPIDPYLLVITPVPTPGVYSGNTITWGPTTLPANSGWQSVGFSAVVAENIPKDRGISNIAYAACTEIPTDIPSNTNNVSVDVSAMKLTKITTYPNPATGTKAVILFNLTAYARVTIKFFTISGEPVRTMTADNTNLVNAADNHGVIQDIRIGDNRVEWDTMNRRQQKVSSGIYFYRVDAVSPTNEKAYYIDKLAVLR